MDEQEKLNIVTYLVYSVLHQRSESTIDRRPASLAQRPLCLSSYMDLK